MKKFLISIFVIFVFSILYADMDGLDRIIEILDKYEVYDMTYEIFFEDDEKFNENSFSFNESESVTIDELEGQLEAMLNLPTALINYVCWWGDTPYYTYFCYPQIFGSDYDGVCNWLEWGPESTVFNYTCLENNLIYYGDLPFPHHEWYGCGQLFKWLLAWIPPFGDRPGFWTYIRLTFGSVICDLVVDPF